MEGAPMSGLVRLHPLEAAGYRSAQLACDHCGGLLPVQRYQGNPRRWCSEACRVAAWRADRVVDLPAGTTADRASTSLATGRPPTRAPGPAAAEPEPRH